jgi:hypothetical protein
MNHKVRDKEAEMMRRGGEEEFGSVWEEKRASCVGS